MRGSGQRGGRLLTLCGKRSENPWIEQVLRSQEGKPPCAACAAEDAACMLVGCVVISCKVCTGSGLGLPRTAPAYRDGFRFSLTEAAVRRRAIDEGACETCLGKGFLYTSKGHALEEFPLWPVDP